MSLQIIDCEQSSPEWYSARLGIPTASEFKKLVAVNKDAKDKKTRTEYMRKLAGEVLTGVPMESYTNEHMERGKVMEEDARDLYAMITKADLRRVGFIRNGNTGCSPDSLIGDDGGLEIKTALPHVQIERLERGDLPAEHRLQVQGCIWLSERKWWDFVSFCPKLPMFTIRVQRDEQCIAELSAAVNTFNAELNDLIARIRSYGEKAVAA